MKTDIHYCKNGLTVFFIANTPQGEDAWREIARHASIYSFAIKASLKHHTLKKTTMKNKFYVIRAFRKVWRLVKNALNTFKAIKEFLTT